MTQYARPNTDISKTGWTGVSDNTNLYSNIDESSASEADYNYSTHNAIRTYECKLSGVSDPSSGSGHVVSYRIAASDSSGSIPGSGDSGNSLDVAISVYQGTTLIATTTITVPEDPETQTLTLSSGEANAITDYSDLRIRFVTTASGGSGSSRRGMAVFWCELAVPDAVTEQYAVKTGNWNDTTVWSTGVVPTTGTVYSNNYDVTVNVNSSATVVTSVAGTVAVAGGGFFLANGVTLTANCYAGAGHGVSITGNGFAANVIGDVYGSSTTTNRYGAIASANNSVLTVTGNAYGGSQTNSSGVGLTSTTSTVNLIGNAYGGTGSGAAGARATGGTLNVTGNGYGSDSGSGQGVYYSGSTTSGTITGHLYGSNSYGGSILSAGTLTVNGNTVGGVNASADGLYVASSANVTVTGSSTGGVSTSATSYGIEHAGTGLVTVATAISSAKAAGVHNGTAGGTLTVESVVTDASGTSPCSGKVSVTDLSAFTALVRSSSSSVTLSAEVGLPSPFEPSPVFGGA